MKRYYKSTHKFDRNQFLLFVALFSTQSTVLAQEIDLFSLSLEELRNVVVESASKYPELATDIPANIIVINRNEIETYGYKTLEELIKNIPGFYLQNDTEDLMIGIRGITGGGVQFMVNGVSQHPVRISQLTVPEFSRFNIPIESVDRIEVIRGPMSVIYGNNAFQGSINIITNDLDTAGSMISTSIGSNEESSVFGRYAKKYNDDTSLTINAGVYNTNGLSGNYSDMMSDAQFSALQPGQHRSIDGDTDQQRLSIDLSLRDNGFFSDLRSSRIEYGVFFFTPGFDNGTRIELDTLHFSLGNKDSISKTLQYKVQAIFSQEKYAITDFDLISPTVTGIQTQTSDRSEVELNLIHKPNKKLSTVYGYRYYTISNTRNFVRATDLGLVADDKISDINKHDIFAQSDYSISRSLSLIGGARVSYTQDYNVTERRDITNPSAVTDDINVDGRTDKSIRAAAVYTLDNNDIVKFMYGEALQDNDVATLQAPEEITTTEINYTLLRDRMSMGISMFHNKIEKINRSVQRFNSGTGLYESTNDNSTKWETNGVEMILKMRPTNNIDSEISITWQETDDKANNIDPGNSPELIGKIKLAYQYNSKYTYSLFTHYVDSMKADWQFVPSATQGQFTRLGNDVDSYWNVGINLRYKHPNQHFTANLHVANLLNEAIQQPASELVPLEKGLIVSERIVTASGSWKF